MAGAKSINQKKSKRYLAAVFLLILLGVVVWYLARTNIPVLEPAGQIGSKERQLIFYALLLSVIVVVPVFGMTIFIVLKYREGNKKPKRYSPEWDHSRLYETVWWGVPAAIITVLSIITWSSSHALDPYKALAATKKPLNVQVVALNWKWLFIYPKQNIASVNLVEMPVNTPVDFHITSDTVMNSFWIPQLGGQIYAMPGMTTQLHLVASRAGNFYGSPANIAGSGFARMTFTAKAVSGSAFDSWVKKAQSSDQSMNLAAYEQLSKPSDGVPVHYYKSVTANLFNNIVMKYMMPTTGGSMRSGSVNNLAKGRL